MQRTRGLVRFYPQLFGQGAAAKFVLDQGSVALSTLRQPEHQLAVRLLAPGLEFHQAPEAGNGVRQIARGGIAFAEDGEALQHQLTQPRPLAEHPALEARCIAHVEAFQKVGTVERQRSLQLLRLGTLCLRH